MTNLQVKPYLLTIRQVAIILQVHKNTVRNYISEGKLKGHNPKGIRPGAKGLRITVESVKEYLRKYVLDEFNDAALDAQIQQIVQAPARRRVISTGIGNE